MATQSELKYNRLMEKSEELFINLGYKAISVEEIAEAAGISKMTIYKHFKSKEDLLFEVVISMMNKGTAFLEGEIHNISGTLEKIDYLMQFNLEVSKGYSMAFMNDIMSIPYVTEKILEEKYKVSRKLFGDIINEGIKKGEIRQLNADFITDMLIMITESFGKKYFTNINSREDIENVVKDFYDFLKYGLLGGEGVKK